jgi:cobalamin biosynthesis Mg chelatase CobN
VRLALQVVLSLIAGVALAWGASSCGSGDGASTVGTKAKEAVTSVSTSADRKKPQTNTPARTKTNDVKPKTKTSPNTKTVTETKTVESKPPKPKTVTETKTVAGPSPPAQVTNQTNVHSTTNQPDEGLPWWGWLLISLAVAAIAIGMYAIGRRRRHDSSETTAGPHPPDEPPKLSSMGPDGPQPPGIPDTGIPDGPPPEEPPYGPPR